MPSYTFLNTTTNEVETHIVRMSELDKFKLDNPQLERHFTADSLPSFVDPTKIGMGGAKVDNGFKEVMHKIAENTPGASQLKTKY